MNRLLSLSMQCVLWSAAALCWLTPSAALARTEPGVLKLEKAVCERRDGTSIGCSSTLSFDYRSLSVSFDDVFVVASKAGGMKKSELVRMTADLEVGRGAAPSPLTIDLRGFVSRPLGSRVKVKVKLAVEHGPRFRGRTTFTVPVHDLGTEANYLARGSCKANWGKEGGNGRVILTLDIMVKTPRNGEQTLVTVDSVDLVFPPAKTAGEAKNSF